MINTILTMTPHTSLNDKINTATESIHGSTSDHHTNQYLINTKINIQSPYMKQLS